MKSIKKRNNMKNINNINKINKLNKLMVIILIIFIILFSNTYFLKIYGNEDLENGNSNEVKVEENKDNKNNNDSNKEENSNKTEEKTNTQESNKTENTLNTNSTTETEKKENKTNTTNTTKNNKKTSTSTSKSSNTNNKTNTTKSTVNKATNSNTNTIINANVDANENVNQINVNEISEENNTNKEEKQKFTLKEIKLSYIDKNNERQIINYTPEFKEDVYNYYCNIDDDISKIDISFNEDNYNEGNYDYNENISIKGNENIPDGISQILITIKNEETYSKVYIIEVTKGQNSIASKANKRKKVIFTLIGVLSVLTLFFIIQAKRYSKTKHMKTRTSKREKRAINRARDRKLNAMINKLKIDEEE